MDRENLTMLTVLTALTGALVEHVLLEADEEGVRATGVAYRTEHGTHEEVAAATEVVLCAGAIGSPHGRNIGKVAAARRQVEHVHYALRDGHVRALHHRGAA